MQPFSDHCADCPLQRELDELRVILRQASARQVRPFRAHSCYERECLCGRMIQSAKREGDTPCVCGRVLSVVDKGITEVAG